MTFLAGLCLLFIGLKLGHVIDWEWMYVLMPVWLPFAIVLAFMIIAGLITLIGLVVDTAMGRRSNYRVRFRFPSSYRRGR